jgi:hypothetical protein
LLRFAAVGPVAHCHGRNAVLLAEREELCPRLFERFLALDEIENRVVEKLPGAVDDRALAARSLAGVDAEHGFGAVGSGEQ